MVKFGLMKVFEQDTLVKMNIIKSSLLMLETGDFITFQVVPANPPFQPFLLLTICITILTFMFWFLPITNIEEQKKQSENKEKNVKEEKTRKAGIMG